MKKLISFTGSALFLLALAASGCINKIHDSSSQFPNCVGTTAAFNPYNPSNPYSVTLRGRDTIKVHFYFTSYVPANIFSADTWHMWVETDSAATRRYYDGTCSQYYSSKKWYAESGLRYEGQDAPCHFDFEIFSCSKVSGSCWLETVQTRDTSSYSFTGTKP